MVLVLQRFMGILKCFSRVVGFLLSIRFHDGGWFNIVIKRLAYEFIHGYGEYTQKLCKSFKRFLYLPFLQSKACFKGTLALKKHFEWLVKRSE